jgi:GNAT superfamily N-acetyltransferase
MSIEVTVACEADGAEFLELVDALADYEELPRPTDDARERLLRDAFSERRRFDLFIARTDGRAVGYAVVFETYSTFLALPTLYLEDLFVRPEARGTGAGSALFSRVRTEARERGCGRLEWACLNWNQLAIDFYARRGANHLDEWRSYRLTADQFE